MNLTNFSCTVLAVLVGLRRKRFLVALVSIALGALLLLLPAEGQARPRSLRTFLTTKISSDKGCISWKPRPHFRLTIFSKIVLERAARSPMFFSSPKQAQSGFVSPKVVHVA